MGESICHFLNLLELEDMNVLDPWIFSVFTLLAFHTKPILLHACKFRNIYSIFTIWPNLGTYFLNNILSYSIPFHIVFFAVLLPSLLLSKRKEVCPSSHLPPLSSLKPSPNITSSVKPSLHPWSELSKLLLRPHGKILYLCWLFLATHCGFRLVVQYQNWAHAPCGRGIIYIFIPGG